MKDCGNDKKVAALMALAANFGKEFPECLLAIWLDLLAPYPAELVSRAVKLVIQEYEYKTMPPYAVLKKCLDRLSGAVSGEQNAQLMADAEWGRLLEAMQSRGLYHAKPDLHPVTAHVLRCLGGWERACLWPLDSLDFRRREFLRLWHETAPIAEYLALPEQVKKSGLKAAGEILGCVFTPLEAGK